jgi:hypothetical protein
MRLLPDNAKDEPVKRYRPLADTEGDIDRVLRTGALFGSGAATPSAAALAAFATAAAGKAPEFEQVDGNPLGPVADRDDAPRLAGVVAQRADLRMVEGVDERARATALAARRRVNHR